MILVIILATLISSCGLEKLLSSGVLISGTKTIYEISRMNNDFVVLPKTKYYIGRSVVAQHILNQYRIYDNVKLKNYIKKIGHTLAMSSQHPETFQDYRFIVLDSDQINAFAAPSGFIFITSGAIKFAESEDEIAAILAHEISHIVLDHSIRSLKDKTKKSIAGKLLKLGIMFAVQNQNITNSVDLFEDLVNEIGQQVLNGYDKEMETEADINTVKLMIRTGYNPKKLASVIKRLKDKSSKTHGQPKERASIVNAEIIKQSKILDMIKSSKKRQKRFMKMQLFFQK